MEKKLYVGNLAFRTTEDELLQWFEGAGFPVDNAKIITNRETGESKGFGFVELKSDAHVQSAIGKMHEQPLHGRKITVNEARPQEPRDTHRGRTGGFSRGEPRW